MENNKENSFNKDKHKKEKFRLIRNILFYLRDRRESWVYYSILGTPTCLLLLLIYFKIALFIKQYNLSEELSLLGILFTIPIVLAYLLMIASNIADSMSESQNAHDNYMNYMKFIFKILFFTANVIVLIYGILHIQKVTSNTIFIFFFILDSYILSGYILKLLKKGVIFFKNNDNFIAVIKLIISLTSGFIAFIGSITALLVAIDKFLH